MLLSGVDQLGRKPSSSGGAEAVVSVWKEGTGEGISSSGSPLAGLGRIGLVTNQAACTVDFETTAQTVLDACRRTRLATLTCVLGPQHGYFQTEQDNMKETPDSVFVFPDGTRLPLFSLYSQTREPTAEHAQQLDTFVVDMLDVGCRVYTYMLTMAGCLRAAARFGKKVVVLDRPNPLGLSHFDSEDGAWRRVEGNVLDPRSLHSFVGHYALPMRHGLTMGELARYFLAQEGLQVDLSVIRVTTDGATGYERRTSLQPEQHSRSWVLPSPNLPSWDSTFFFPSFVTLEGTNLSEGRGTTTPFQLVGAPFFNSQEFISSLHKTQALQAGKGGAKHRHDSVLGVKAREHHFRPTFNKHSGEVCHGVFFHVLDPEAPNLFALGQHFLRFVMLRHSSQFRYKDTPYEYNDTDNPLLLIVGDRRWEGTYQSFLSRGASPSAAADCLLEAEEEVFQETLLWAHESAQTFARDTARFHLYA